ncbi:MAG TPA: hypothetical protein VGQ17_17635 [Gemmatimonadales bacterium]|jgi:hypothetical protein|nr:hypothetical protein [Gemmatimonadales bacterium]
MLKGIAAALFSATYLLGVSSDAKWSATLSPQNGSKISGTASVEAKGADSTRFTVSVRGATPDVALAWHMHTGKCSEAGSIVGSETSYPELRPGTGGTAESMVTLPIAPPAAGSPFTIQVHKPAKAGGEGAAGAMDTPAKGSKTLVSCGELKPLGANP